ncbi:hypothetical protein KEM52_000408 [Ascosphaera acerosa]|nr:hypothetical protein KEM52_000408 [Ascosphaera acerosa]
MSPSSPPPAPAAPTLDDLYFPSRELGAGISAVLSSLRRSALSTHNRLRSIADDALFVQHVAQRYALPVVANERCGSWYIPPAEKAGSAYFKSTDGHTGQWRFSLRRLNLQLLDILAREGRSDLLGLPATHRPGSMPDALSKTIPIWCAVLNRALFPEAHASHPVQFAQGFLPASEESHIEKLIAGHVEAFRGLNLDLARLRATLGRPLRLAWVTRETTPLPPGLQDLVATTNGQGRVLSAGSTTPTIVLCSASKRVHGAEMSEGGYIQGAGDDAEAWAAGLAPPVFWAHKDAIMSCEEPALPELISRLVEDEQCRGAVAEAAVLVAPTQNVFIMRAPSSAAPLNDGYLRIDCNATPAAPDLGTEHKSEPESTQPAAKPLMLGLTPGKLGSRALRKVLGTVRQAVSRALRAQPSQPILIMDDSGRDLAVGVALMLLCSFYDGEGRYDVSAARRRIDKDLIRQRLAWIVSAKPDANPSRATLQSVNAFLMERHP